MTELDSAIVIVGLPKYGKTTIAKHEVEKHLRAYPTGIALVHDPNAQFDDLCATFESVDAWRAAATKAAAEQQPFPRGAAFTCAASAVAALAIELGKQHNKAKDVRLPIKLVYDETSMMDTSGPTHMDQLDTMILANRRHWGIAPVFNVQRVTALTEAFYSQATDVIIFAQPSQTRTRKLEDYLGLREGTLDPLVGGPKYQHVRFRQGEGLV